jgi:hypothetical protein
MCHWLRLAFSVTPNIVCDFLSLPEDRNKSCPQKVLFSSYVEFRTKDEVQKPSYSERSK